MIFTNLLTNMVLIQMGIIQTNTPELQHYVMQKLVADAQTVAVKWHLDTNLIVTNKITQFSADAGTRGPSGQVVFAGRYRFWTGRGAFLGFADEYYCWPADSGRKFIEDRVHPRDSEDVALIFRWAEETNLLTMKKAEQIADSALRSSNVPIAEMRLKSPKVKDQVHWTSRDGTPCLLPYYKFDWKPNESLDRDWCRIDVSGVSSNIVFISCGSRLFFGLPPTNYLEMLGLSTNTLFVSPIRVPRQKAPSYLLYPLPIPYGRDQWEVLD